MLRFTVVPRVLLIGIFCGAFLIGLGLAVIGLGWHDWWWPMTLVCLLPLCWRRRLLLAVPAVVIVGLGLGVWRGSDILQRISTYQTVFGQKVVVSGSVVDDATFNSKKQIDFMLSNVRINGVSLPGQVRVTSFSPIEPKRGDQIEATGKLYSGFGNYQAAVFYADVKTLGAADSPVDSLRRQFAASIQSILPEPQASLGLGFLLGIKSQLPADMTAQLKVLSLTHIVVASGYNLTILVRLGRRIFEKRSKFLTAASSAALMAGFVAVTGFSASMSRAALVTGLAMAAWYFGRRVHPILLLLIAAGITAAINPLYLWNDLGWWLSFLSFAGVLLLAPLLQCRIFGSKKPKVIGQVVLETLSAQLLSLPLMIFAFGNLSALALPANVLIVPLIPLAMACTFVAGAVGVLLPAVAGLMAWPATVLLGYISQLIALLSHFDGAAMKVSVVAPVMVCLYALLLLAGILLRYKTKLRYMSTSVVE